VPRQPLGEVFGFPADTFSAQAEYYRQNRLCPFNNKVPSCTKDKANDPLGVCSVNHDNGVVITCPIRFRQDWRIAVDAADFFFAPGTAWTSLVEIGITDGDGLAAGNIDVVLVSYDDDGRLTDFGALEVQAVYISGNVRRPFEHYMKNRGSELTIDWSGMPFYPRPDYLSSSRKRLAPQLLYKGSILKGWGKKQAVAVQRSFFRTLPELPQVAANEADLVWLVYDLDYDADHGAYALALKERIYTLFDPALDRITKPRVGPIEPFVELLQSRLDAKLTGGAAPDAPTLLDIVEPDVTDRGQQ
jgi:hypothetical protein